MKWTIEKINILKEGILNGLTHEQISFKTGFVKNAVRLKAQKLKLKSKYLENLKEINTCKNCNINFESLKSERRKFCSQSCSAKYNNASKEKKYLSNTCKNCNIEIHDKNIYCSRKCNKEYEYKERIKLWKNGELKSYSGKTKAITPWLRKYILKKYNNTCNNCGWNELHPIDKKPLVEINHIDGNAENNLESNLEVLCPNCHSMTHNFRARNKISTRIRK